MCNIDFKNIEVKEFKSKNEAFEQLCNYIFEIYGEKNGFEAKFISNNGAGGDGGVEAYWKFDNEEEYGIQSKYFIDSFGNTQIRQIEQSINTVLKNHPKISKYFICIPINLTNIRNGKGFSQREKFENIQKKYKDIELVLWDADELKNYLFVEYQEKCLGLIRYFFNKEVFTQKWFKNHFKEIEIQAGPRYSTKNNVKQDIFYSLITSAITHNDVLNIRNLYKKTKQYFCYLLREIDNKDTVKVIKNVFNDFCKLSENLLYKEKVEISNYDGFSEKYKNCFNLLCDIEVIRDNFYYKSEIIKNINKITNIVKSFSSKSIIIRGLAGTGKTHLVCDLVRESIEKEQFISVLFFGNRFKECSLEKSIISQINEFDNLDSFFSTLNAYAKMTNQIAYFIIDAINEWDSLKNNEKLVEINLIKNKIEQYTNLKFIITCREEYFNDIFKSSDNFEIKPINGFSDNIMEAFYLFCKYYNIKYPAKLCLFPEISNPLILKTICEIFKNKNFPENYLSISEIIKIYLEHLNEVISEKLNIDIRENLVIKEIDKIIQFLYKNSNKNIPIEVIKEEIKNIEPYKEWSKQILYNLEKNNFLVLGKDYCYISYQKYKDYLFSDLFLNEITNIETVSKDNFYEKIINLIDNNVNSKEGLIDMLSILFPEKYKFDLIDIYKGREVDKYDLDIIIYAFYKSIYYRNPNSISVKTLNFFESLKKIKFGEEYCDFSDYYWETLIKTAYIESHIFNAEYLHKKLYSLSMADIDADWTQYISNNCTGEIHKTFDLKHIVDMFLKINNETLSDKTILLSVTLLLWFTASTDKYLREYSVKACVNILKHKENLLIEIFNKFKDVNDLFVKECLYLVVYGCILYSKKNDNLKEISDLLYENVFNKNPVLPNITIRESAYHSIKEISNKLGVSYKYDRLEPPYDYKISLKSYPTKENLEIYIDKEKDNPHKYYLHALTKIRSSYIYDSTTFFDFFCYTLNDITKFNNIDKEKAAYWICKKAYDYGWDIEKHGQFDVDVSLDSSRAPKSIERIGKKYQWLAFREYLCNLVDNYKYEDSSVSYYDILKEYRSIDPTYFLIKEREYFFCNTKRGIFNPFYESYFKNEIFENQKKWLDDTQDDICKGKNLIECKLDEKNIIIFDNIINFYEDKENSINSEYYRDFGIQINSIICNKSDKVNILEVLKKYSETTNGFQLICENEVPDCYYKEYNENIKEKCNNILKRKDLLKNTDYYRSTTKLPIPSLFGEDIFYERMPSAKLIKKLGLNLSDDNRWITDDGQTVIFTKDNIWVANKDIFLKLLWNCSLDILYFVSTEKRLLHKENKDIIPWNWYFTIYSYDSNFVLEELYYKKLPH